MRVVSVPGQCEAHGQCAIVNAELFVLDDEGYTAIGSAGIKVPADMEQIARRGVEACPLQALRIVEE
jgi:ferredoxin